MHRSDPELSRLIDQVRTAQASKSPLDIRGGGTKAFYGGVPRGEALEMRGLAGITCLEPDELVVTVRAGTPLAELEAALDRHGQCLAFEPPRFEADGAEAARLEARSSGGGTVGGMVAAGLAGPARVKAGSVRDHVLGATLLNAHGELLTFGGQVMKNVAGYDVSRLLVGAMGVLGVICQISLRVSPMPVARATLEFEMSEAQALAWFDAQRSRPSSIEATSWIDGRLRVRLAGAHAAVRSAAGLLGGRRLDAETADAWWNAVRDQRHPFFHPQPAELSAGGRLWRVALPPHAPALALSSALDASCIEWGGGQRWLRTAADAAEVRAAAASAGGHATLFRALHKEGGAFTPLEAPLMRIHRELKRAFDPDALFNRGRLYADL